jgi:hypothetical protein
VGRGLGPWAGPARPEIQTDRAGPKFKHYEPFRAWAGPGRAARMYTYTHLYGHKEPRYNELLKYPSRFLDPPSLVHRLTMFVMEP